MMNTSATERDEISKILFPHKGLFPQRVSLRGLGTHHYTKRTLALFENKMEQALAVFYTFQNIQNLKPASFASFKTSDASS